MRETEVASFRVPKGTVARLKMLAHRLSLEGGRDVTWGAIVRGALKALLEASNTYEQRVTCPNT